MTDNVKISPFYPWVDIGNGKYKCFICENEIEPFPGIFPNKCSMCKSNMRNHISYNEYIRERKNCGL